MTIPPLAAETIFQIGSFSVTNTYINSTITVVFFLAAGFLIKRNIKDIPSGLQNFFEACIEIMLGYTDQVTGSRKKSIAALPIVGTLFLFILFSNWFGILPGIGSIGIFKDGNEFIPLLRPANTDLNMTLAMAVFGVFISNILGIVAIGFWKYFNKFVKVADIIMAVKKGGVMGIFTALVEFGAGFIEIVSEVAKMVSLSLRLFGNVFAGEVLLTVLAGIMAFVAPLPFVALEILIGLIQAMVFAMLVLVYLSVATMPVHSEQH